MGSAARPDERREHCQDAIEPEVTDTPSGGVMPWPDSTNAQPAAAGGARTRGQEPPAAVPCEDNGWGAVLPWETSPYYDFRVVDSAGIRVADFTDPNDARLAIRAVNCHAGLVAALEGLEQLFSREGEDYTATYERVADLFHADTQMLRPGKDSPAELGDDFATREAAYQRWLAGRTNAARVALDAGATWVVGLGIVAGERVE